MLCWLRGDDPPFPPISSQARWLGQLPVDRLGALLRQRTRILDRLKALSSGSPPPPVVTARTPERTVAENAVLQAQKDLAAARAELETLLTRVTALHPDAARAQRAVDDATQRLHRAERQRARASQVQPFVEVAQLALGRAGLGREPGGAAGGASERGLGEGEWTEQVVPVGVRGEQAARCLESGLRHQLGQQLELVGEDRGVDQEGLGARRPGAVVTTIAPASAPIPSGRQSDIFSHANRSRRCSAPSIAGHNVGGGSGTSRACMFVTSARRSASVASARTATMSGRGVMTSRTSVSPKSTIDSISRRSSRSIRPSCSPASR